MKKLTNKDLKNKQKLIENMDIMLGSFLNEIHYMEIAVERMKETFKNKDEHYLFIIEYYKNMVKNYRFNFARFEHLRNLAIAGKITLEKLKIYNDIIKDVVIDIQRTSDTITSICIVEGAENSSESICEVI